MANTLSTTLNYRGALYILGQNQTPFLSMIGGVNGGRRETSEQFAVSVTGTTSSASQSAITEDASILAGTATTYAKTQTYNTTQIMKNIAQVSFKKAGNAGRMGGINNDEAGSSPDTLQFQKDMALLQMAKDIDYSFIQGSYQAAANSATAGKTRGMIEAITTNTTATGGASLSKALIDALLKKMFDSGSPMSNLVMFVGATQKIRITDIYGYAPEDRNVGGVNVQQIETDFGRIGVMLEPNMASDDVLICEIDVCSPVFNPIVFDGNSAPEVSLEAGSDVMWVKTGTVGAMYGGFYYSQVGLDYGPEIWHGTLTGLAT
jgi:hypothetical protein